MFNGIEELQDPPTILPYDTCSASTGEEDEMRPDIMKTDLVSEIILLTSGFVMVVTLIFTVIAALPSRP